LSLLCSYTGIISAPAAGSVLSLPTQTQFVKRHQGIFYILLLGTVRAHIGRILLTRYFAWI